MSYIKMSRLDNTDSKPQIQSQVWNFNKTSWHLHTGHTLHLILHILLLATVVMVTRLLSINSSTDHIVITVLFTTQSESANNSVFCQSRLHRCYICRRILMDWWKFYGFFICMHLMHPQNSPWKKVAFKGRIWIVLLAFLK